MIALAWPLVALVALAVFGHLYRERTHARSFLTAESNTNVGLLRDRCIEALEKTVMLQKTLGADIEQLRQRVDVIDNRTATADGVTFQSRRRQL